MGETRFFINIIILVLSTTWSIFAHAQPQPQMSYCLTAAYEAEVAAFKKNKKYMIAVDDMKWEIPAGCRTHTYEISLRGEEGFKIITEIGGETWSVDEKFNFARLARAGAKTEAFVPKKKAGKDAKEKEAKSADVKPDELAIRKNLFRPWILAIVV